MKQFLLIFLLLALLPLPGLAKTPFHPAQFPDHLAPPPGLAEQIRLELAEEQQRSQSAAQCPAPQFKLSADRAKPVHIIFSFVDHWEPVLGFDSSTSMCLQWRDDYASMAHKHHDADGRCPQHTWFCLTMEKKTLSIIAQAAFKGLGEMEVHIHHGSENDDGVDNTQAMADLIDHYLAFLHRVGACCTAELQPRSYFGFIHGMWALDNSRLSNGHRQYCGVNEELNLLRAKGCYGDFTFPAWGTMQPAWGSKIYAATDSPEPKSYDEPAHIRQLTTAGPPPSADELMIFEGPGAGDYVVNIDAFSLPTLARMNQWVQDNVHVPGCDNWVFVKVFTHSAVNLELPDGYSSMIGEAADKFYSDIERVYDDGVNYKLHYANSRELYNMTMAALDGKRGDPNDFRNYAIKEPVNTHLFCSADSSLLSFDGANRKAALELLEAPKEVTLWAKDFTPADSILEADSIDGPFKKTDARLGASEEAGLVLTDPTPSRYYLLGEQLPSSTTKLWRSYP